MPPVKMLDEPIRSPVVVETWISLNPGNECHQRESLRGFLRGKGIPTAQWFVDGKPMHPVVFNIDN